MVFIQLRLMWYQSFHIITSFYSISKTLSHNQFTQLAPRGHNDIERWIRKPKCCTIAFLKPQICVAKQPRKSKASFFTQSTWGTSYLHEFQDSEDCNSARHRWSRNRSWGSRTLHRVAWGGFWTLATALPSRAPLHPAPLLLLPTVVQGSFGTSACSIPMYAPFS